MKTASAPVTAAAEIRGEGQPPLAHVGRDEIVEAGLVDRDLAAQQALDLRRVVVDADHDMTEIGETGSRHQADIARADHRDVHRSALLLRASHKVPGRRSRSIDPTFEACSRISAMPAPIVTNRRLGKLRSSPRNMRRRPVSASGLRALFYDGSMSFHHPIDLHQPLEQHAELRQWNHVRPVRGRTVRVLVCLDEQPRDAHRDGGAGEGRDEFTLAARAIAEPARLLHGMRRIEDDRRAGRARHDRQGAHIRYQRAIAEARSALGEQHIAIAGAGDLRRHMDHIGGREKRALLHIDDAAGPRRRHEEIGLPAEQGWNLQDVDDARDLGALMRLMHVGRHRNAVALLDLREHRQRRVEPDAARTGARGAVGLVEGRLEHEADPEPPRQLRQRAADVERMVAALHRARAADEREGEVRAEGDAADVYAGVEGNIWAIGQGVIHSRSRGPHPGPPPLRGRGRRFGAS